MRGSGAAQKRPSSEVRTSVGRREKPPKPGGSAERSVAVLLAAPSVSDAVSGRAGLSLRLFYGSACPPPDVRQSISKVRAVSLSTVMRTFIVCSGSSGSIFSGHSTRQRSPE